ncbi:MAG: 30S ribosomal protein S17e [Nitrososphaerota archaeon]
MGRVKTGRVKRLAKEIFEKYSKEINENFEKNKALVKQVLEGEKSKKIINLIAGYLTILAKQKSETENKEANISTTSTAKL